MTRPSAVVAVRRRDRSPWRGVGATLVAVLAGGLAAAAAGAWRPGLLVVAGGLVATAVVRVARPGADLGTLSVRGPWLDALVLLAAALVLAVAVLALP